MTASQTLEGGLCCKTWDCMQRWESLMQLFARLEHPVKPHFSEPYSWYSKKKTTTSRAPLGRAVTKLNKSILKSYDYDVDPSKESFSENEPTHISSEGTEKWSSQTPQFKLDQCSFKGASYKGVKHHTRMKQKINWWTKWLQCWWIPICKDSLSRWFKIRRLQGENKTKL